MSAESKNARDATPPSDEKDGASDDSSGVTTSTPLTAPSTAPPRATQATPFEKIQTAAGIAFSEAMNPAPPSDRRTAEQKESDAKMHRMVVAELKKDEQAARDFLAEFKHHAPAESMHAGSLPKATGHAAELTAGE
uniref:Uncharacterized protein n=1 Tax=viral metagenome TaxID=1070528 RepID=A0A6C0ASM5_9ZZZZ